jgi:hypothetical protein
MPKAHFYTRCLALLGVLCCASSLLMTPAAAAPPGARLVVGIKDGKPSPQNLDVTNRKADMIYFQNNDSVTYKIVWTDKNYGSPFVAPNSPLDKGTINLEPFTGPSGPRKIHDQAKPGQRYAFDVMKVKDGKTTRAGSGSVVVE